MSFRPPVRDDLSMLPGYHSPQLDVSVRLNTNESPEPPPSGFIQDVARKVAELDWHRYPDRGATELRSRLAAHHDVDPANIFVANGSNEVLQTILLAWGGPGRSALTFEPTYAMHAQIAKVTGTEHIAAARNEHFAIDPVPAKQLAENERPTVTFICSPNNPTGLLEAPEFVEDMLATVEPFGLLVVDEAYAQFSDWSALTLFDNERPLIVSRTFSKTWAMAAARLGYLIAPDWVVERLETAVLPYHLDAVTQIAGIVALDYENDMRARVARLVEQRGRIQASLGSLGVEYWPSSANFVLFRPGPDAASDLWNQLVDAGVLVRDCSSWPGLDGCLRVTVGSETENSAFLDAVTAILS